MKSRNANYKLLKSVDAFEPVGPEFMEGTSGNIQNMVFEGTELYKQILPDYGYFPAYDHVSAPMLLSRLCALFKGLQLDVGGQEYYKVTWTTALKHKKTGAIVTFYDHKGAASFGSDDKARKSKQVIKDLEKLLKVLIDERCPHPYDGCVVGEIA